MQSQVGVWAASVLGLLAGGDARSARRPSVDRVVADAGVVLHGTVRSQTSCHDRDDSVAWTFVTLRVADVLMGSIDTPSTFVFRIPGGTHADGTVSTVLGTPRFEVGRELYVMLRYSEEGEASRTPLIWDGGAVFEKFDLPNGGTAIVDGYGEPIYYGLGPYPLVGAPDKVLRNLAVVDPARSTAAARTELQAINRAAEWSGTGLAEGPWAGGIRLAVSNFADQLGGSCEAQLQGSVSGTHLSATGSCVADYVGTLRIALSGDRSRGVWTGTVVAVPDVDSTEAQSFKWSSDSDRNDALTGGGAGTLTIDADEGDLVASLHMGYVGTRRLATQSEFESWLLDAIDRHSSDSAGIGKSISRNAATCAVTNSVAELEVSP